MGAIPYPNLKQISQQAQNDIPAAKLLMVAIALILSLDPTYGNGNGVLDKLKQMAEKFA